MGGDVACAARVAIFEPGAADVRVLVVDGNFDVAEEAFRFVADLDAGGTGADDDEAEFASCVEWLLGDAVAVEVFVAVPAVLCGCQLGDEHDTPLAYAKSVYGATSFRWSTTWDSPCSAYDSTLTSPSGTADMVMILLFAMLSLGLDP